jgi:hypothetical protein
MNSIKIRIAVIASLVVLSLGLVVTSTLAKQDNGGECKPGWGWGDTNNCHSGPPGGPSTHPVFGNP